jgi:hypothetical protein
MEKRAINPGDWQDQFDFSQAIEVRGAGRAGVDDRDRSDGGGIGG